MRPRRPCDPLYARLFSLDASLEAMFKGDMREQGRKLISMISVAVNSLTRLESIVPAVQALGRRHAGYGVEDRHYATVEDALVWTPRQGLGARSASRSPGACAGTSNTT